MFYRQTFYMQESLLQQSFFYVFWLSGRLKRFGVKSNFFFNNFKKFSFQQISAFCIQHKVGHFYYSL